MISFFMMSGGRHPFHALSDADVEEKIANGQPDMSSVSDRLAVDLVEKMLAIPANRPPADKLLKYSHHALLSVI
jgi:serine/threonine protein kinase